MITVYTVAYNEELQIKFLIDHYRARFKDCHIVVYDNESTDKTVEIARSHGCDVITYSTNNQIIDSRYLEIKNNCWKSAKTDWVLICDVDELLDIDSQQLQEEEHLDTTIIRASGYNMINMEDNTDLHQMNHGVRSHAYDKSYCFNRKLIQEINYTPGCHTAAPFGTVRYSGQSYPAYHYNFINLELSLEKYRNYGKRLSKENLDKGWGLHYLFGEDKIRKEFQDLRILAQPLFQTKR